MTRSLVIVGCGGFGREVFSLVEAVNRSGEPQWRVEGFVDDAPAPLDLERVRALGADVIGSVADLGHRRGATAATIAVGSPTVRAALAARLRPSPVFFPPLVHPSATLGREVTLGAGAVVAAGARLSTNIRLGAHVQVDQNVTVGHDTDLGDFCRLNPQACVSGSVHIGCRVLIGANATVLPGLRVGDGATVGAQACAVRDVVEDSTVKGVPAR